LLNRLRGPSAAALAAVASFLFPISLYAQTHPAKQSIEGLWLSDGYRMLFEFKGDDLLSFEITKLSCIEEPKASRKSEAGPAGEVVFAQDDDVLRIFPGTSKDTRWLQEDGSISSILLRRTRSRPKRCGRRLDDTPILDYQVFWETFAEQYAFFGLHNVDWLAADRNFRPQVTSETKPEDLFRIFRDMIDPLHDAHTFIQADSIRKVFRGHRPEIERIQKETMARIWEIIETKYLAAGVRDFCNGQLQFGLLHPSQAAALSESEPNGQTDLIGYAPAQNEATGPQRLASECHPAAPKLHRWPPL
jgi:hypothetical protein